MDDVTELARLRLEAAEINELAVRFGVSRSAVLANLERAGVAGRRWPGRTLSPDELGEAHELYDSGLSFVAVGERLGVDRRYLRRVLHEIGVWLDRQVASRVDRDWLASRATLPSHRRRGWRYRSNVGKTE